MTLDEVLKGVDELKLLYDKHKLTPSEDRTGGLFILADEVRRLNVESERLREGLTVAVRGLDRALFVIAKQELGTEVNSSWMMGLKGDLQSSRATLACEKDRK